MHALKNFSIGVTVVLALLVAMGVLYLNLRQPGFIDFFFHRTRYEAIIKAINSLSLRPGESRLFKLGENFNPSTLEQIPGFERPSTRNLSVERHQAGDYRVDLITVDDGHAGSAGYIFLEKPLQKNETPPEPPQEPGNHYKKINDHWWAFYNNNG